MSSLQNKDPDFVGFEPQFKDLTDYIIKITHEIWESRNVDTIRKYYGKDMKLHTPGGVIDGAENVVFNTFQMLNTFPDRRLLPADVIWSKEADKTYYSSHRLLSVMCHSGDGIYGKPTGKRVIMHTVADCAVKENVIFEEWLVRDQAAVLTQLGKSPVKYAAKLAEKQIEDGTEKEHLNWAEEVSNSITSDTAGAYAKKYAEGFSKIWSQGQLGVIEELYHEACHVEGPGNRSLYGHEMLNRFYFLYLSMFKDIKVSIDHLIELREDEMPVRVSMRWRLSGIHAGNGIFGEPTNQPVYILGINQAHFSRGKLISEWMMIDELALHKQVILNRMME